MAESHTLPPHRVNYRANMWALHHLGARKVIGVNAVGGIRHDMGPRAIVVPDQIIDYTHGRYTSFCDVEGAEVKHIDFSEPYTASLRHALIVAAQKVGVAVMDGGCYGATQGPRLESRAEIARMKRDGCDLVGMTGMPEAALGARTGARLRPAWRWLPISPRLPATEAENQHRGNLRPPGGGHCRGTSDTCRVAQKLSNTIGPGSYQARAHIALYPETCRYFPCARGGGPRGRGGSRRDLVHPVL